VSKKRYVIKLTEEERQHLTDILRKGTHPTRRVQKAQILLRADASEDGVQIMEALGASASMV
jgi:hypothetical protein